MGGDLAVESEVGRGSRFTLWLPAAALDQGLDDRFPSSGLPLAAADGHLAEVGEAIQLRAVEIVKAIDRRLRADPHVGMAAGLEEAVLEDHQSAFVSAVAQALVVMAREGERLDLLQDSSDIQWHIAQRHGAQRARLGWTEPALRREMEILQEEVVAAAIVAAEARGADADAVTAALERILDQAGRAGMRGLRVALRPRPD